MALSVLKMEKNIRFSYSAIFLQNFRKEWCGMLFKYYKTKIQKNIPMSSIVNVTYGLTNRKLPVNTQFCNNKNSNSLQYPKYSNLFI